MLTFNDNKAGMAGLDKERITKIIESNTSENYSNFSKKQQDRINEKTAAIKKRLEAVTPAEWARAEKEMDELAAKLECHRDLRRDCVHIDMDAYFAAVEMRDDPRLRTVPMAVGSMAMLSTSNYIARRFGVRAAMPGFIAKKLCPQLELVHGNYDKYKRESAVVREIRFRVEQATGLTCSAGIAPNFMLAKICSDMNKPNGQFELENSYASVMEFLNPLSIRKESFLRIALGLPGRPSASDPRRKSISVERTFTPISDRDGLLEVMEKVCDMLIEDMPTAGIVGGRCVTLKLKLSSFDVLTRSITPGRLVSTREDILAIAREALDRELPNEIRLLGIRLSNLQFTHDRPSDNTVSVLDFWKKRQELDVAAIEDNEASTESSSNLDNTVLCPICNVPLKNDDRLVNQHVDECLNSAVLVDSPRPNQEVKPTRKRKTTIETFFAKKERK
ncbi:ImpB/MucB/SamB family protein [Ancylostoma ceylanicum]|uniref:DNA polymerase kappa n=1 Tax=Ancylostoma ceylanicum TaxID=53326 RepID=A0A0D6LVN2_9BILA|nr:ImpB/MucB/SamB family protein [Ancylostoma ceylanicum]